jgi:hypothetical protein
MVGVTFDPITTAAVSGPEANIVPPELASNIARCVTVPTELVVLGHKMSALLLTDPAAGVPIALVTSTRW